MSPSDDLSPTVDWSSSTPAPEEEGTRYGHFRVLTKPDGHLWELGRGAMGVTYKALDENLQAPVTLKLIRCEQIGRQQARERFLREARAAAALRHPHVATVFHLGEEEGTIFYAMEFVEGETLEARLRRDGRIPALPALLITRQVASALAAAQKIGLMHRDIKPSNIMLAATDDGSIQVKVIDFGLAKQVDGEGAESDAPTLTVAGFVGTPHFASPEQLEEQELDGRTDVYSLGVTLYYMLAGAPPFGGSIAQVISQHLQRPPPMERLSDQHPAVLALVEELLRKDREDRPTAAELLPRLDACLQALQPASATALFSSTMGKAAWSEGVADPGSLVPSSSVSAAVAPAALPETEKSAPRPPKRPVVFVLGGMGLLAFLGAAGLWWFGAGHSSRKEDAAALAAQTAPSPTPTAATPSASPPAAESTGKSASFAEALHEARELERDDHPLPALLAYADLVRFYPEEVAPRLGLEKALEKLEARLASEGLTPQEIPKVRPVLETAAAHGFVSAQFLLGEILHPHQPAAAVKHLQEAAKQGHAEAAARLGWLYSSGRAGGPPDFSQAVRWFEVAAGLNHPYAMTMLADCYLRGLGVDKPDPKRAVQLLEQASDLGEDRAMDLLGYLNRRGLGMDQPNPRRAFALFQRAAELGNLDAQGNLGIMHMLGESVPADPAKAVALWREGAEKGNATCMLFLAKSLLDPSLGQDPAAATGWFVKAARAGNAEAVAWCEEQEINWRQGGAPAVVSQQESPAPPEGKAEQADIPLQ